MEKKISIISGNLKILKLKFKTSKNPNMESLSTTLSNSGGYLQTGRAQCDFLMLQITIGINRTNGRETLKFTPNHPIGACSSS